MYNRHPGHPPALLPGSPSTGHGAAWTGAQQGEPMGDVAEGELGLQGSGAEVLLGIPLQLGCLGRVCVCVCVCARPPECACLLWGGQLETPGCSWRGRAWLGNTRTPTWLRAPWNPEAPAAGAPGWGWGQAAGMGGQPAAAAQSPLPVPSPPLSIEQERQTHRPDFRFPFCSFPASSRP